MTDQTDAVERVARADMVERVKAAIVDSTGGWLIGQLSGRDLDRMTRAAIAAIPAAAPAPPAGGDAPWWHSSPEDGDDAIHWMDNATQELARLTTALAAERAEVGRLKAALKQMRAERDTQAQMHDEVRKTMGDAVDAARDEARAEIARLEREIQGCRSTIANMDTADGMRKRGLLPGLELALLLALEVKNDRLACWDGGEHGQFYKDEADGAESAADLIRKEIARLTAAEQRGDATPPSPTPVGD